MAWCDQCGNGFAADGGTCPTCGHKVPYGKPTAIATPPPPPTPEQLVYAIAADPPNRMTFGKLCALGCWAWTFIAGSWLHEPGSATVAFFGACLFTVIALCGG